MPQRPQGFGTDTVTIRINVYLTSPGGRVCKPARAGARMPVGMPERIRVRLEREPRPPCIGLPAVTGEAPRVASGGASSPFRISIKVECRWEFFCAERNGFPPCRRPLEAGAYKICGHYCSGGLAPNQEEGSWVLQSRRTIFREGTSRPVPEFFSRR